ncbi:MAG: 50S ribosomal protein L29 [Patescibacteria group bacterium]|jgi:ribosomal protein L29
MINPNELAQKTHDELAKMATDVNAEIRDLRFKVATRQHAKVRSLRHAKRDLARIMTGLNAKKSTS